MFLKCLFYAFKLFGIAPMAIKALTSKKNKACHFLFVSSRLGILHNCILLCISISTIYFIIDDTLSRSLFTDKSNLELVLDTACGICVALTSVVILLKMSINREKAIIIINKLNIIYQRKVESDKKNPSILLVGSVKIIIFSIFIPTIFAAIALGLEQSSILISCLPFTTYQMTIIQYTLILKLLHYLYQSTNTELQSVLTSKVPISIVQNRLLGMDTQRVSTKIELLREIHVVLSHLSNEVSGFYALPMFFCISNKFLVLIQYCYYIATVLSHKQDTTGQYEIILHCMSFSTVEALSIVYLTRAAGLVVTESKRTGEIVSQLIVDCPNKLVLKQLNGFFSYLLQVQVDFSVFNLYQINESLLTSITSYITTYMVILLQFKETSCRSGSTEHTENMSTPPSVD
ncbi:gustatory receptor 42 [Nasonia vitripennis]|uniref:Gustatory receptor n=1 Tax=Nasonia vitripennis TaxID=7425 RepID=A0A7M6UG71_NASVI|nr:gustatory receptor 42 [Nasonia vitripennis]